MFLIASVLIPNDVEIDGGKAGGTTTRLADAAPPVPPSVEVTFPVTLFWVPELVPVTLIENVHEVLAASDAPDSDAELAPGVAVIVPPPQDPVSPFGFETASPDGNVSVNATFDSVVPVLLF